MNKTDLEKILTEHTLWLHNEGGKRADLRGADLGEADLKGANLREADFRGANLGEADLRGANLREADLRETTLGWANLRKANLGWANLSEADLRGADLRGANLGGANLRGTNLGGARLSEANLDFSVFPLWCVQIVSREEDRRLQDLLVGKTFIGDGKGGGLAVKLTLHFKKNRALECSSDFYQAFPKPVKTIGYYKVEDQVLTVGCHPQEFEKPIVWDFTVKNNGDELFFNHSDLEAEGSMKDNWMSLKKQ